MSDGDTVARVRGAIDANDLDELLRITDDLVDARDWDGVEVVRDFARRAFERGRQLWPAAENAEYRLALEGPPERAAAVLVEGAGRFALGPLSEVAASTHTWAQLAPYVLPGPVAALTAHERVLRGESVDAASVPAADVLDVPLRLQRWEPEYLLATYRRDRVQVPGPQPVRGRPLVPASAAPQRIEDRAVEDALRAVVHGWTAASEGHARVTCVRGDAAAAIAALGARDVRGAWIDGAEALRVLAWAGAIGGAHGRRR